MKTGFDKTNFIYMLIAVALFLLYISVMPDNSASVQLTWDQNTEADLVGYNVYFGRYSGNTKTMPNTTKVANVQSMVIIPVDDPTGTWYYRVTAYNSQMESAFSNVVQVRWVRTPANVKFQKIEIR